MRLPFYLAVIAALPLAQKPLKVDVDLVTVNVMVSDTHGRSVLGLEPKDFEVYEDRVAQKIEFFSVEEVPASIGLVFDTSGSMAPAIGVAGNAISNFLNMGTTDDEFFLITFQNRPR